MCIFFLNFYIQQICFAFDFSINSDTTRSVPHMKHNSCLANIFIIYYIRHICIAYKSLVIIW